MKKLATLVAGGLLLSGAAFAAPLNDNATSTSEGAKGQPSQTTNPTGMDRARSGTTGSGSERMNAPAAAKESREKAKSPGSMDAGAKQEK